MAIVGDTPADKVYRIKTFVKGYKMFEVIADDEAAQIIAEAQMRGMYKQFLVNVGNFYDEWKASNPEGNFAIFLNKQEGDIFYGKATDSLYTGINYALKKAELSETWRMIKRDGHLVFTRKALA